MYHQNIHNTYYLPVEKTYTRLCRREVDENVHILSRRQALIKFELRVCTERRPIALLRVLPRDFPFLPFSLSLFLRTIAFKAIRRTPLAVRRIVTKGFAVILDLICMLMIMDVYPLLFPGFVAACYFFKSCLARQFTRKKCRWLLMLYQVVLHLHLSLKGVSTAAKLKH